MGQFHAPHPCEVGVPRCKVLNPRHPLFRFHQLLDECFAAIRFENNLFLPTIGELPNHLSPTA
jgi:hypothetical protein